MQTFGEILKQLNKNFKYISWQGFMLTFDGEVEDEFMGACAYEDGEIYSLDGDTYDEGSEIIHYAVDKADKEFTDFHNGRMIKIEKGDEILTVWEDCFYEFADGKMQKMGNHDELVRKAIKQLEEKSNES